MSAEGFISAERPAIRLAELRAEKSESSERWPITLRLDVGVYMHMDIVMASAIVAELKAILEVLDNE